MLPEQTHNLATVSIKFSLTITENFIIKMTSTISWSLFCTMISCMFSFQLEDYKSIFKSKLSKWTFGPNHTFAAKNQIYPFSLAVTVELFNNSSNSRQINVEDDHMMYAQVKPINDAEGISSQNACNGSVTKLNQ